MLKVLEILGGERCMLVCERKETKAGMTIATLVGNNVKIETPCEVILPRECFSKADFIYLLLPKDFDLEKTKTISEVDLLAIA